MKATLSQFEDLYVLNTGRYSYLTYDIEDIIALEEKWRFNS